MFVGYKQIVAHYNYCDSNRTSVRVDGNTHNRIVIHRLVAGRVAVEGDRTNVRAGSEQPRKARWLGGAVVSVSSFATCSRGRRDYYRYGIFRSRHPHQPRNNPCEEWGRTRGATPCLSSNAYLAPVAPFCSSGSRLLALTISRIVRLASPLPMRRCLLPCHDLQVVTPAGL